MLTEVSTGHGGSLQCFGDSVVQLMFREDTLRRIWAFNRVPGSRKVIEDFIVQPNILET